MSTKIGYKTVKLLRQIFNSKISTIPCISSRPQKIDLCPNFTDTFSDIPPIFQQNDVNRSTPESTGINSQTIYNYVSRLSNDKTLNLHSITILRKNNIIFEASFGDYVLYAPHVCFSLSKSITNIAIGLLYDEGRLSLDDSVTNILKHKLSQKQINSHKKITIRHLLTMSSGIFFNEASSATEADWLSGFFDSISLFTPGSRFNYNSMNSFVLSAIVKEITGMGMQDFLIQRLWNPLNITNIHWELSPYGIEKGGWGLYISQQDLAKVAILFLQKGIWNGKRILSEEWIRMSTSFQIQTKKNMGNYDYGFQIWTGRDNNTYLFNGMFGQNMLFYPDCDTAIIINSGNSELFQQSSFFKISNSFFLNDAPQSSESDFYNIQSNDTHAKLCKLKNELKKYNFSLQEGDWKKCCLALNGLHFHTLDDESASVSVLPLMLQIIQNNYTVGIKDFFFYVDNSKEAPTLILNVTEGVNNIPIPIGFDKALYSKINVNGEIYTIGVRGSFFENSTEYKADFIEINISFIEYSSQRSLKFIFKDKNNVILEFNEAPSSLFLIKNLTYVSENRRNDRAIKTKKITDKVINDLLISRVHNVFNLKIKYSLINSSEN